MDVPIEMHGGSDLAEKIARAAIRDRMSRSNIGMDLEYAFSRRLRLVLSKHHLPFQPPEVLGPARDASCEVERAKISESIGKANLYA